MTSSAGVSNSDSFDVSRILRETPIAAIDFHQSIDSTNTRAQELAEAATHPFPLLVLAESQDAGRGRGTNRWWSGPGALTFSLLIDRASTELPPEQLPLIALLSGLAVAETLAPLLPASDVRLKWPNDVYLNGRKVCGILSEVVAPARVVVGIGINVNNRLCDAPPEVQSLATSLRDVGMRSFDRTELLIALLYRFFESLPAVSNADGEFVEQWRSRCMLHGRTVQLRTGSRSVTGVCHSIDHEGALMLQTEGGIQRFFGGTIARIL